MGLWGLGIDPGRLASREAEKHPWQLATLYGLSFSK
jgi:hypothetical protein